MNIFENKEILIGKVDKEACSLSLLYEIACKAREGLGMIGYLLDSYMAGFMEAVRSLPIRSAVEAGEAAADRLYALCSDTLFCQDKARQNSVFYSKALEMLLEHKGFTAYQEDDTRQGLLFFSIVEEYYPIAIQQYEAEQLQRLSSTDDVQMESLYQKIVEKTSENLMDRLCFQMKHSFISVGLLPAFAQGYTLGTMNKMLIRDMETNRCFFQLMLDIREGAGEQ